MIISTEGDILRDDSEAIVNTVNDLVKATHRWNARKRQFTPRQIGLAATALESDGWIAPSKNR